MEVSNWCKQVEDENRYKLTIFDIENINPSIKADLLKKALNFSNKCIGVQETDREIVFYVHVSLFCSTRRKFRLRKDGCLRWCGGV